MVSDILPGPTPLRQCTRRAKTEIHASCPGPPTCQALRSRSEGAMGASEAHPTGSTKVSEDNRRCLGSGQLHPQDVAQFTGTSEAPEPKKTPEYMINIAPACSCRSQAAPAPSAR